MSDPKIIIALDYSAARPALVLAERLEPSLCRLKVGKELFTATGPDLVEQLMRRGFEIFLDL
ncbi:MAG: orotidine 5'-phosphate decarboxylase / HUMPS family protein, partial [Gallionella sp.]